MSKLSRDVIFVYHAAYNVAYHASLYIAYHAGALYLVALCLAVSLSHATSRCTPFHHVLFHGASAGRNCTGDGQSGYDAIVLTNIATSLSEVAFIKHADVDDDFTLRKLGGFCSYAQDPPCRNLCASPMKCTLIDTASTVCAVISCCVRGNSCSKRATQPLASTLF